MAMKYILKDGRPEPANGGLDWAEWFESADRHLALDVINGVQVSTVFLGIDHNFLGGPPVLWETMIFDGPQDQEQWRYTSPEEALTNHRRIVERISLKTRKKRRQWDFRMPVHGGPTQCFYHPLA